MPAKEAGAESPAARPAGGPVLLWRPVVGQAVRLPSLVSESPVPPIDYFSASFLPALKLSKFRIALNTRK